jgi:hypothetical protein
MTVTKPQAQMLATLAAACRPIGARRWDTAGIMAALERLHDRDLGEVIMATIRAARDRDVDTPGILPTAGPHWREQLKPLPFTPQVLDSSQRCSICSMTEAACRIRHDVTDHEFESAAMAAKRRAEADPEAVTGAIHALKASIEPTEVKPMKTLDQLEAERPGFAARLAAIQARHPVPAMQEPTPEEGA